jgi:hypothetical protein
LAAFLLEERLASLVVIAAGIALSGAGAGRVYRQRMTPT